MKKLLGLIFDLDGTLLDSAPDLRQALNETLKAHGRASLSLEAVKGMTGDGMLPMLERAIAATATPDVQPLKAFDLFQKFIVNYRSLPPDKIQIYPGVEQILEHYKSAGVKIGLCTNKQEAATRALLNSLNLAHYFDFIAGGDTFELHKPHPRHVEGVAEGMDTPLSGCIMVGDSINDVSAAHGAKIPCIVVRQGYGDADQIGGDSVIDGIAELPRALAELHYAV